MFILEKANKYIFITIIFLFFVLYWKTIHFDVFYDAQLFTLDS